MKTTTKATKAQVISTAQDLEGRVQQLQELQNILLALLGLVVIANLLF